MFTTFSNSAANLASVISTGFLGIWDVSKEALEAGHLSGMMKLTILTTCIQFSAILFIKLLPRTREDLTKLNYETSSKIGGIVFLTVTFISIVYSVIAGVLNVVTPGWMGESRK